MVKLQNLVYIEMVGNGQYNSAVQGGFIPKEFYAKHKDYIDEYVTWFNELDGKHSEVKADIIIESCTDSTVHNESLLNRFNSAVCFSKISEEMIENLYDDCGLTESDVTEINNINKEIASRLKTVSVVTFDGTII